MTYSWDMREQPASDNQRILRTRAAILGAFVKLVLKRRYETIRIADLVKEAGVGKATFYEHFRGKSDVLIAAMEPILLALSTAASGRAARSYIQGMVSHLWERRSTARIILNSAAAPIIQRRLAEMVRLHIERADSASVAPSIRATGIAAAQVAMLRSWLAGEVSCTQNEITDRMIACSTLCLPSRR
ncbi:TetR/AcrR family transcriptional regulator [Sphingomonas koreensis]|nr:TetR/AcrR family transcriptional regulator [Sphingomonas koreensis]